MNKKIQSITGTMLEDASIGELLVMLQLRLAQYSASNLNKSPNVAYRIKTVAHWVNDIVEVERAYTGDKS